MKKFRYIIAAVTMLAIGAASLSAQDFRTGYFLDNFTYSYRLNPSLQTDSSVRILFGGLIDNIEISPEMNFGINDVVFPVGGKLVSGLNSAVPASKFPGLLPAKAVENLRLNENILTVGWRSAKNDRIFHTLEINLRVNESLSLPKEIFALLKQGGKGQTYSASNASARINSYGEVAYGFSITNDHWDFGGRLKALVGVTSVRANVDNMTVALGNEDVSISGNGELFSADGFVKFPTDAQGNILFQPQGGSMSPSGFGAALDLGATWHTDRFSVTFGVNDLGLLGWSKNGTHASMSASPTTIDAKDLKDITNLFRFKKDNKTGKTTEMLPATFNAGVRYHMPFYERLSAGFIGTYRLDGIYSWYEARAGLTVTPIDAISLSGSFAYSSFGTGFGAALSVKVPGINLFLGVDSLPTSYTSNMLPVGKIGNMCVNAGLVLAFK